MRKLDRSMNRKSVDFGGAALLALGGISRRLTRLDGRILRDRFPWQEPFSGIFYLGFLVKSQRSNCDICQCSQALGCRFI